jgi:hypothetical protein
VTLCKVVLDKEAVADVQFVELCLPSPGAVTVTFLCRVPSVTLGKAFVKCFPDFVECFRHSAKVTVFGSVSFSTFLICTLSCIFFAQFCPSAL